MFFKAGVLKNFSNFTGKHLWWSLFLIKLQVLKHKCFPVKFEKFFKDTFFYRTYPVAASGVTHLAKLKKIANDKNYKSTAQQGNICQKVT